MPLYYNPLTVTKNQGAAVYCSGARDYVTGATGVGGYLRDRAVSGSWTSLEFLHVAVPSGGSALPTGYYVPASDHYISSGVTVIGGATPNGDLRIDPTGFIEGSYWNTGAVTDLPKNTFMSGALYAVGIGTTAISILKNFTNKIYVTAGTDEKCQSCIKLGATDAINYKNTDFEKYFEDKKIKVDIILDMVGGSYLKKNLRCPWKILFLRQ